MPTSPAPPVIGISGYSDSGKTVLLERLVPRLQARGLRVAVIKDCDHPVQADRPGKDTDRLFAAGADVLANGPNESFVRLHASRMSLAECLCCLAPNYDVVLAEGFREVAIPKIRLDDEPDERVLLRLAGQDASATVEDGVAAAERVVWEYLKSGKRAAEPER